MALFARKKRRRIIRRRKVSIVRQFAYGFLSITVVILLGYATWYVTHLPRFTITTVKVEGGITVSNDDVKKTVEDALSGNYMFLVPKRFAYFYPHSDIVDRLNAMPRVHNIHVTRTNGTTLTVTFDEYIPDALWCASEDENATCLFVTADGYAFTEAPELTGGAYMRYVNESSSSTIGTTVFDDTTFSNVQTLLHDLDTKLRLRAAMVVETKDKDIDYHLSGGGTLLTTSSMTPKQTFDNLSTVLTSDQYKHLAPGNFNYIDLRFGDKIFVNENIASATSTPDDPESLQATTTATTISTQ